MTNHYREITLALAGVCQCGALVYDLSHHGRCDPAALQTVLYSILDLNPPSLLAVYGGEAHALRPGLSTLSALLNVSGHARQGSSADLTRYVLSLIVLARQLQRDTDAQARLRARLRPLSPLRDPEDLLTPAMLHTLATIYTDIISPLGPRIQVTGSPPVLRESRVQDTIRAALLAGIRSAVLWQQLGGRKYQLLFARRQLLRQADQWLTAR